MTLKDSLLKESKDAIESKALNFAINVEPMLLEAAQKGRTGFFVSITKENDHVVRSPVFASAVCELLEGVKVKVIQIPTSSMFPNLKKDVLQVSWSDPN